MGNPTGYRVYCSTNNFASPITNTAGLSVTVGLNTNIETRYYVRAFNNIGEGPPSNIWTNKAPAPPPSGTIAISAPVLSATNVAPGQTITGTANVTNGTANPVAISEGWLTARQPGASNQSGPFDDWTPGLAAQTVAPGGVIALTSSWTVRADAPLGIWQAHLAVKIGGTYQDGPNTAFVVNPATQTPPSAPQNLSGNVISASRIDLNWRDNSANEDAFHIERSDNGSAYREIGLTGAGKTWFIDSNLQSRTRYTYRIYAANSFGRSPYSNTWSGKTYR
jgi:hypothetical protein